MSNRNNNIRTSITLIAVCMTLLIGCKKKETEIQYPRNVDFYIRYLSDGNQFKSLCKVSFADSLAVGETDTTNYNITIGGKDMKQLVAPSGNKNYSLQTNLPYNSDYTINIANPQGKIITQATKLPGIDSVKTEKEISLSKGTTIEYSGKPLSADETIIIMIIGKGSKSSSSTIQGPTTDNRLLLKPENLTMLEAGPVDLYLVRTFNQDAVNENMNFYFRNEFFTKTYKINLVK